MSGKTEITVGEQQTDQHTFKINNFKKFMKVGEEVRSSFIEMFPPSRKKIAFVVKPLPENGPYEDTYSQYTDYFEGSWADITNNDKFFSLELIAAKGFDLPRLAGKVQIELGESKQTVNFGNPQDEKYVKFDANDRLIRFQPKKISYLRTTGGNNYTDVAPYLIHVKLSGAEEESLEMKFSLFCPGEVNNVQEKALPDSLKSSMYLKELNKAIMEDNSTTDLKITCGDKKKKKTFHVHKNFFCARSPVFRAAVETDMLEKKTSEIYIEEVDEKTMREMIHYVYTGELTGVELDVQMVAWVADKYHLSGMMDLLCFRMKEDEVEDEYIADMLIAAQRHDSDELKMIAMNKLRNKKEILSQAAFRKKLEGHQTILYDIIQEFVTN